MQKLSKIANFRPVFIAFLGIMAGIFIGFLVYNSLPVFLTILLGLLTIFVLGITVKTLSSFKGIICVLSLFLALGLGASYLNQIIYYSESLNGEYTIIGRASEQIYNTTGGKRVILSRLELENGKVLNSKLSLTIYGDLEDNSGAEVIEITAGDYIKFKAKITTQNVNIFKDIPKVDGIILGGVKYYASTASKNIIIESGSANFFENIKETSQNNIFEYVKDTNIAGLIYATIFGDKNFIEESIMENFQISGVSHILAVSGLHVGFLAAIILGICKLLRLKNKPTLVIITLVLLCYVFLCGFSASILRAAIMFEIMLIAGLLGKRNDLLNSLSLAGILILLISPFSMFSLGFIFSFGCMFSLIFLTKPIAKLLYKIFNVSKSKLLNSLAASLAVNLGLLCLQIFFFHSFTPIAILANLIIIPLFAVAFSVSVVFTILSLLISQIGYMFVVSEVVYTLLTQIVSSISVLGKITVNNPFWLVCFWSIFIFLCSNYTFIKNKFKIIAVVIAIIVVSGASVFYTSPKIPTDNAIIKLAEGNILTAKSGYTAVIIENFNKEELKALLNEVKHRRLKADTVILTKDTSAEFEYFIKNNPELNFICFRTNSNGLLPNLTNLKIIQPSEYLSVGGVEFRGFYLSGSLTAVDIKFANNKRAVVIPNLNSSKISFIHAHEYLINADIFLVYRITNHMVNLLPENSNVYISKESGYENSKHNALNENREEFIIKFNL